MFLLQRAWLSCQYPFLNFYRLSTLASKVKFSLSVSIRNCYHGNRCSLNIPYRNELFWSSKHSFRNISLRSYFNFYLNNTCTAASGITNPIFTICRNHHLYVIVCIKMMWSVFNAKQARAQALFYLV